MLNFSGTDTIDKLIASIQALPDQTKEVDESFIKPAKLREAKAKVLNWDPRKVILAHGEWQAENGREFLVRALEWIS